MPALNRATCYLQLSASIRCTALRDCTVRAARPAETELGCPNVQQVRSCSEGVFDGFALALSHPRTVGRLTMCHYLITVEFDDGQLATTQYSSPSDVKTKLAEVVNDLTDADGIEHFRSVTVTQAA